MSLCVDGQHTEKENTLRRGNVQGADQPLIGELMMAVYQEGEAWREEVGKKKSGRPDNRWFAMFRCGHCGKLKRMMVKEAKKSESCGCYRLKKITKHGLYKTGTYASWQAMHKRCGKPNSVGYGNYGGKGISVCEKWKCFDGFLEDMGERPEGTTLDRIDSNGNYEPSNCRWATWDVQANNRSDNRVLSINGVSMTVAQWSRQPGAVGMEAIRSRLKYGWSDADAVFKPIQIARDKWKVS